MATVDVPGFGQAINDELKMGCWAENTDGSLIFIESTEGGNVIFSMFDVSKDPIIEYRESMPEDGFKKTFSWRKDDAKVANEKWIWHNRTPFPWDKVIKAGFSDGPRIASANGIKTAAERVADSLKMQGSIIRADVKTRTSQIMPRVNAIKDKIRRAVAELGR